LFFLRQPEDPRQVFFFGVWEDPQKALNNYLKVAADLHAGRQPKLNSINSDGMTVKDVANCFLTEQMAAGQKRGRRHTFVTH
jgi:hypothetical protein